MTELEDLVRQRVQESLRVKERLLQRDQVKVIAEIAKVLVEAYRKGKKVILFGNGGSAADAQHIAAELGGKYYLDRDPLPAITLTVNTSLLTALSNDYSFDTVFARQLEALGQEGDVTIGITTSGNSENVIQALKVAKEKGLITVGFTGRDGGRLKDVVDYCLHIPSDDTPRIQEGHITVGHIICEIVERELFDADAKQENKKHKAVFLDRDGVINKKAPEGDYIKSWDEFKFLSDVDVAIRRLNEKGFLVVVVSNQRGIARGVMTEDDLKEIHTRMKYELCKGGTIIDAIYYCPHDVDAHCGCRKPNPGLLFRAAKEHDIDLERSWMIGDSKSDIEAGKRARCKAILLANPDPVCSGVEREFIAKSLAEAVNWILTV